MQLVCMLCGWRTEPDDPDMKKFLLADMAEHVMENHRDAVAEWFRNNRKNWNYVRRDVIRLLQEKPPAIGLDGTPYFFSESKLIERLKAIRDPGDFIEELYRAFKSAESAEHKCIQDAADYHALRDLVYWIGLYWIERNPDRVYECGKGTALGTLDDYISKLEKSAQHTDDLDSLRKVLQAVKKSLEFELRRVEDLLERIS